MTHATHRPSRHATTTPDTKACAVCGTRLSAYNTGVTCWTHTLELPWKGPNTKPR